MTHPFRIAALLLLLVAGSTYGQQCTRRSPCQVALGNPLTGGRWSLGPASPIPVDAADEATCCAACQLLVGCVLYDFSNRTSACRLHSFSVPLDLSSPLEDADDAAAFAVPAGQWSNQQWTGALDAVRVVQAVSTPAACGGQCLTTCGCTYWQHDADAGRCVLYRQQAQQVSPVLAAGGSAVTAGVLFGPNLQLKLASAQPNWRTARYAPQTSQPWNETLYNTNNASDTSFNTVGLSRVPFVLATDATVFSGWESNITIDVGGVDRQQLGGGPGYLDSPLALGRLLVDNSTVPGGINVSMPLNASVTLGPGRLQRVGFSLIAAPVNVTTRLNYTVNKCVFPSSGSAAPGLPALLASELTVLEVLQAGGFCGSTDQLPPNAANGFVSVDVELRMQLPVDLKDTQITAAGASCPASLDLCASSTTQLPNSKWVYYPLPTSTTPMTTPAACCAACRADLACMFWDFNTTSGECALYDQSLSQASLSGGDGSGSGSGGDGVSQVANARLPLLTNQQDSVAGLLDSKQYAAASWSADPDLQVSIPPGSTAASWCAARCGVTCGCRYWTARMSDMQCLLIFPKAQPVTLLYDTNSFLPTTSGIRLGPALQVEVRATAIDWSTVKQGSAGSADVYTAVYNGGSGNATQSSVMVPVQATWVASETLLDGVPVQLTLPVYSSPGTNGSVVVEQGNVRNSSVGPLEVFVVQGQTQDTTVFVNVSLPSPLTLNASTQVQLRNTVRQRPVTLPMVVTLAVRRCSASTATDAAALGQAGDLLNFGAASTLSSALTRQGSQFDALVRSVLPLDSQLQAAGFCGVAGYGATAEQALADALVQVTGTMDVTLPSEITSYAVQSSNTPDRTGCSPVFDTAMSAEADLYPGSCNPQTRWQDCCTQCNATAGCVAWTWQPTTTTSSAAGGATGTSACANNCVLKSAVLPTTAASGSVSGSVALGSAGCPVLLPNYALLSTDPSSDRQLPLPSPSRCCQACTLDPSCTSFVHNLTGTCTLQRGISAGRLIQGVTAALVDRAAVVRRRALQDTSSGKDGQAVQCPSVVMVPERGGLAAVLGRSGVTWQQVCCFNNLPDCSAPPVGAMLLIPCKDAAPKSCAVSDAVKTVARTAQGCACASSSTYTPPGTTVPYTSAGACFPPSLAPQGLQGGAWCQLEGGSSCSTSPTVQVEGRAAAPCASNSTQGCSLLPGVALQVGGGVGGQTSIGLNNGQNTLVQGVAGCCALCQITQKCIGFAFVMPSADSDPTTTTGQCWLYSIYTTTAADPRVVSGIRPASPATSTTRRRHLQSTPTSTSSSTSSSSSCTTAVLPLAKGTNMSSLNSTSQLNGLSWQEVCCANAAVSNCTSLPSDITILVPCGKNDPLLGNGASCAAVGQANLVVLEESTNWGLAVGVGLAATVVGLVLGLFAGWGAARVRTKRRHASMVLKSSGLDEGHALARSGVRGDGGDGKRGDGKHKGSNKALHGRYSWDRGYIVKTSNSITVAGRLRAANNRPIVARFFENDEAFTREKMFYKIAAKCGGSFADVMDVFQSPGKGIMSALVIQRGDYDMIRWQQLPAARNRQAGQLLLRCVAEALAQLHAQDAVHGDVAPGHVWWCNDAFRWKLFGVHAWGEAGQAVKESRGERALRYMAPEIAKAHASKQPIIATPASDMWSLGCLVWEICTGTPLFDVTVPEEEVLSALQGDQPLPFENHAALWMTFEEEQARRLAQHLLRRSPAERWTAKRVLSHALLRETETNAITSQDIKHIRDKVRRATAVLRELQEVDAAQLRQTAISVLVCGVGFEEVAVHHTAGADGVDHYDDDDDDVGSEGSARVGAYRGDAVAELMGHGGVQTTATVSVSEGSSSTPETAPAAPLNTMRNRSDSARMDSTTLPSLPHTTTPPPASKPTTDGAHTTTTPTAATKLGDGRALQGETGDKSMGKSGGMYLRDLSIKAAQMDKGLSRERMVELYTQGTLTTTAAPTTLLSTVESALEDGGEGAGAGAPGQPTCLLHADRHYVLRVELRYGEQETLPLPVEGVDSLYLLCGEYEDGDMELAVQTLEDECTPTCWVGFAILSTAGYPLGELQYELHLGLRLKSTREVVQLKKEVAVQMHSSQASFAVETTGAKLMDAWNNTPEWVKVSVAAGRLLYNLYNM